MWVAPSLNKTHVAFIVVGIHHATHDYGTRITLPVLRWTVDTREDLQLAELIFQHFGHDEFDWQEAAAACAEHPEWLRINAHIEQKAA